MYLLPKEQKPMDTNLGLRHQKRKIGLYNNDINNSQGETAESKMAIPEPREPPAVMKATNWRLDDLADEMGTADGGERIDVIMNPHRHETT
ncbi:hypothetical protein VFPPC_16094 [Pochonia chlamydosporia 170]|uniref:Uncharacterized protein n=1 Tax=Pochonia chlamydosporia 170 TaxID=1380566 RepID=A0A179FN03_METCM|nr:hypothetical protein VFPPC_16094 [Pochonia chlamydosporia 170]OAQ66986.2 hypothetical protein VFPPC_16094 [Pochonia chlamydosporia 170]